MTLSVVVITFNEEDNIEACLAPWRWANEIIIVDSGSTDKTLDRAKEFTSNIYHVPFKDYATQKNEAISKASCDWVFVVDADERLTPGLARELKKIVRSGKQDAVYAIPRKTHFFTKRLNYSGTEDDAPIRLFPRNALKFSQPVHEVAETQLPVIRLKDPLIHLSTRNMAQYRIKMERYIPLEVRTMKEKGRKAGPVEVLLKPPAKFIQLYFLKLGILDGWVGFQYAVLAAHYDFKKYLALMRG